MKNGWGGNLKTEISYMLYVITELCYISPKKYFGEII